jgi:hypothetical protein
VTDAKQVPALVAAHQDCLRTPMYRAYSRTMHRLDLETAFEFVDHDRPESEKEESRKNAEAVADLWLEQQIDLLNIATLFHVTEPMMAVTMAAAEKLDGDGEHDRWSEEALPARNGFLVFERPLYILDARGVQTGVSALSWHVYHVTNLADGHRYNIEFAFYADASDPADSYGRVVSENPGIHALGRWHLVMAGAVPIGSRLGPLDYNLARINLARLDAVIDQVGPSDEQYVGELIKIAGIEVADPLVAYPVVQLNLYRYLFACFALMQTTTTVLEDLTDKRLARRTRNRHRPPPMVTVISLRHPENYGAYEEGTGRWLTYRSLTRAHWRRVHTRDGIKRVWVLAYWRGPQDAPVWQPKRVTTLRR